MLRQRRKYGSAVRPRSWGGLQRGGERGEREQEKGQEVRSGNMHTCMVCVHTCYVYSPTLPQTLVYTPALDWLSPPSSIHLWPFFRFSLAGHASHETPISNCAGRWSGTRNSCQVLSKHANPKPQSHSNAHKQRLHPYASANTRMPPHICDTYWAWRMMHSSSSKRIAPAPGATCLSRRRREKTTRVVVVVDHSGHVTLLAPSGRK